MNYPSPIERAIKNFSRLPGIGTKTAERLVFFIIRHTKDFQKDFVESMSHINESIHLCTQCGYITDNSNKLCTFCSDPKRDQKILCVVADIQNVLAIEKSGAFHGLYHVLGGTINPIEGVSADKLTIDALVKRLQGQRNVVKEMILATGTDIEGEQTALYITQVCKGIPVLISRLAKGIPRGTSLDYADEITLADAIKDRKKI